MVRPPAVPGTSFAILGGPSPEGPERPQDRKAGPWDRWGPYHMEQSGLSFVDLCIIFQAGAVGLVPGPNFVRKLTKNLDN